MMEANEQITRFKEFIDAHYNTKMHDLANQGKKSLVLDFKELTQYDPELASSLLDDPEDTIRAAELSLEQFDLPKNTKLSRIRFRNLPDSQLMRISDVRSEHLGKFLVMEGIVRQASDVRPQITNAKFECAGCGNSISILQIDSKFKEPSRCTCGWRGKFRLLSKDLIDVQHLKIEEAPESLEGGEQPKRLSVFLKEDLVEPKMEKKTAPGSRINIYGLVKEVPIQLKTGAQSTRYDLILEANHIEAVQEDFSDILLSNEDEQKILEVSRDPLVYEKFTKAIAPSVYGHERIKEGLVLQLMGGVRKEKPDGTRTRGDIHVLLIGDPGSAKSTLMTFISKAAPKARFISGTSASGAGLCIAPDSLIVTNPGGIHKIKDIVEENLKDYSKSYTKDVWNSSNPRSDKKIFTLDENFKIRPKEINQLWRISPPEYMIKVTTQSGKQVIVTTNTKLYSQDLVWKEASEFSENEYLASSRNLNFPENEHKIFCLDLIKSNPVIHNIKDKVKFLIEESCKKMNINKRILAKELDFSELSIYHNWVKKEARGNIKLNNLRKLADYSGTSLEYIMDEKIKCSLYNGHPIEIPKYVDGEFLYFAGLIAGDGDLTKEKNTVTIRFSNSNRKLIEDFIYLSKKLFNVKPNISSVNSEKRPEAWRFGSKLVFEILEELGLPLSPKSDKIDMSNKLLKVNNELLSNYLKGYFDTDGGGIERTKKGSHHVESSSTSKIFSEKLKLVLLRYGIHSKIRKKEARPNKKVNSKKNKFAIIINGKKNLELFKKFIGFNHPEKKEKLDRIINKIKRYDTNIDIIPNARKLIAKVEKDLGIKILKRRDKNGISRDYMQRLLKDLKDIKHENIKTLNLISDSDIFWDKIVKIELIKDHGYEYVYDLTVENSHNFIVNGLLVHNTAAVVKDEFLKGWGLEAGAMVLANKGICCVDEIDKMSPEDRSSLHSAMEQQIVAISKANIQACYSSDTEVLTEIGWKKYSEVKDLKIAQYYPKEDKIEFLKHNGLYVYNFNGLMYNFKDKRNDIFVTPNHRMLIKEPRHKEFSVVEAQNISYSRIKLLNSSKINNSGADYLVLPAIKHKQNRVHPKYTHQHVAKNIPMDLWLEFLGYYLSEGGIETEPTIGISQKHGVKANKIRKCLKKLSEYIGCKLTEIKDEKYVWFKMTCTQLCNYIKDNANGKDDKKTCSINLASLSCNQLKIFYNAMMLDDGSKYDKAYGSTSLDLINLMHGIACLIGKSASLNTHYEENYRPNRKKMYRVTLSNRIQLTINKKSIKKIKYKGKVFCFATDSGFFITRRNGKIAIQGNTLSAQTTLLAAANPKLGRFDPYTPIPSQIDLPSTLINRFDLIFPVRDIPSIEKDEKIAMHVLETSNKAETYQTDISIQFMRKYIAYAKQKIKPKLTKAAINEIKNYYVSLRNPKGMKDDAIKPIPISARQLEGLIRLTEASAKVRLDEKAGKEDARRAIEILNYCLMQVGFDPESGQIDMDRITTGITASARGRIIGIKEIINNLDSSGLKMIPFDTLMTEALSKGIDESKVDEALDQLKKSGEIFEPKKGFISKVG